MHPKLKRFIATAGDLPTVPAVAANIMRLVENPETSADDLRKVIDQDPGVAVRILKVANSSLYGFSRKIETLNHAITLLGFRTVRNLVMAASLRKTFKQFGLPEKLLLDHSTLCGAVAMRLSKEVSCAVDSEEAFTAGLLHDLGKIALNNSSRKEYTKVVARTYNEGVSFREAEMDEFGFDHAELGACVAEKWRLPKRLEYAIRYHHDPESTEKLDSEDRNLVALTTISTACCTRLGVGRRNPVEELEVSVLPAWAMLGLGDDDEERILLIAEEQVKQAAQLVS
jgi:putative nucleotidyltransferase with HDIG domain